MDGLREVHDKIKDVREAGGKYDGMTCAYVVLWGT